MLSCKLITTGTRTNLNELKFAALYYDQVDVFQNIVVSVDKPILSLGEACVVRAVHECLEKDLLEATELLEEEGIATIEKAQVMHLAPLNPSEDPNYTPPTQLEHDLYDRAMFIMRTVGNQLWNLKPEKDGVLIRLAPEALEVHRTFLNDLKVGSKLDLGFLHDYYATMLYHTVMQISLGANVIGTSLIIDDYFKRFYQATIQTKTGHMPVEQQPHFGLDAIRYSVPHVADLPMAAILDLREKLRDELESYRYHINELSNQVTKAEHSTACYASAGEYVQQHINKALKCKLPLKSGQ